MLKVRRRNLKGKRFRRRRKRNKYGFNLIRKNQIVRNKTKIKNFWKRKEKMKPILDPFINNLNSFSMCKRITRKRN